MSRGVSLFPNVQRCAGTMQVIWLGVVLLLCFAMMYWFLEVTSWVRSIVPVALGGPTEKNHCHWCVRCVRLTFILLLLGFPFTYSIGTQAVIGVFDVFGSRPYCVRHDGCKCVLCQ